MIDVWAYQDVEGEVRINFTDGTYLIGCIASIDDEAESELGEDGISLFTPVGAYIGVAQSEIESIEIYDEEYD